VNILFPVPIAIFATVAFLFLVASGRASGLKCVLVASYCGIMVTSFTGGASGGIWLAPLFLFLIGLVVIWRPIMPAFNSTMMTRFTYGMFCLFIVGTFVGLLRYDPSLEFIKAGRFRILFGIPIRYLMALYRFHTVIFLFLAFALPLRYYVDRRLFLRCFLLCWFFSLVLAVAGIIDYFGIYDLAYDYRRLAGFGHVAILGFHRDAAGKMLVAGIFMTFAMTQLTRSYCLKLLGYWSIPILIMGMLTSHSRSAMLMLAAGALSLALTLGGARAIKGVLVTVIGAVIIYIIISQIPVLRERFGFIFGMGFGAYGAGVARLTGWATIIKWLLASPGIIMFGAGFQNYHYFANLQEQVGFLEHPHNIYLQVLAEHGVIGFIIFMVWLISICRWLISWRRTVTDKIDKMMPGIFLAFMFGFMVSSIPGGGLLPSASGVPLFLYFCLLLGIWVSYYRTQMAELNVMWETEYYEDDEQTYDWQPEFQGENYYY
jgi:O-antigen ligase